MQKAQAIVLSPHALKGSGINSCISQHPQDSETQQLSKQLQGVWFSSWIYHESLQALALVPEGGIFKTLGHIGVEMVSETLPDTAQSPHSLS